MICAVACLLKLIVTRREVEMVSRRYGKRSANFPSDISEWVGFHHQVMVLKILNLISPNTRRGLLLVFLFFCTYTVL